MTAFPSHQPHICEGVYKKCKNIFVCVVLCQTSLQNSHTQKKKTREYRTHNNETCARARERVINVETSRGRERDPLFFFFLFFYFSHIPLAIRGSFYNESSYRVSESVKKKSRERNDDD